MKKCLSTVYAVMCQSGLLWCDAYIAFILGSFPELLLIIKSKWKLVIVSPSFYKMNTKILRFLIFIPYCRTITWSEQRIGYLVMRMSSIH